MRRSVGYGEVWENVERDLRKVIEENKGEFPTKEGLSNLGYGSLIAAIYRYHKGLNSVRERMGYGVIQRPKGYWQKGDNFEKEVYKEIKNNGGAFPSQRRLKQIGREDLVSAFKNHGGFYNVREKMGYTLLRYSNNYLKEWENFEKEMRKAIKENGGEFPTTGELIKMKKGALVRVRNYFDGSSSVRERMGYGVIQRPKGYWEKWENFEKEMKRVIERNDGMFPSLGYLYKNKIFDLSNAISRHHGGMDAVRKRMGYDLARKPNGYYQIWGNFEKEMKQAIENNNGKFPSGEKLINLGFGGIKDAIKKYYGGVSAVREKIGYNEKRRVELARELEEVVDRW